MSTTTLPTTTTTVAEDPAGPNIPTPNPFRRGLSGLRRFGPPLPAEALRLSPRNYFSRSTNNSPTPSHQLPQSNLVNRIANSGEGLPVVATGSGSPSVSAPGHAETSLRIQGSNSTEPVPSRTRNTSSMTRHRSFGPQRMTVVDPLSDIRLRTPGSVEEAADGLVDNTAAATTPGREERPQNGKEEQYKQPTICFFSHQEVRQSRPSLNFAPIIRTLPSGSSVIRVGRYSERDGIAAANPARPSDAPVGFKSKVVSRKHCEFSFVDGSWQIKDVSSSSGTFLNHVRLSQPNTESKLFAVKDGDVVQLGIDFRGGEEMIFRCVKIRIECNRSWQKRPNHFNVSRHAQLRKLGENGDQMDENKGECSICLGDVAPCQSLFIAACAHVWHYKCIRRMLMGNQYPQFTCPNCRAITDLEAELDTEPNDDWVQGPNEPTNGHSRDKRPDAPSPQSRTPEVDERPSTRMDRAPDLGDFDLTDIIFDHNTGLRDHDPGFMETPVGEVRRRPPPGPPNRTASRYVPNPPLESVPEPSNALTEPVREASPTSAEIILGEGPMTPRNNAGPVVFDGSAGRSDEGRLERALRDSLSD